MLIQGALRVSGPSEEGREESHGRRDEGKSSSQKVECAGSFFPLAWHVMGGDSVQDMASQSAQLSCFAHEGLARAA